MDYRYLYRAKRKNNGEWVEGYICKCEHEFVISNDAGVGQFIIENSICQCTGLKDKNGKLIWENDIVRFQFDNDDCPFPNNDIKKRIGKVYLADFRASWSIAMGRKGSKYINNDLFKYVQNGNRVDVIGNIFDNPELL